MSSGTNRTEKMTDRFFGLSLDMLCIAGFDGHFRHINPAFEGTLDWTEEELIGRPILDLVHPEDRLSAVEALSRLKGGSALSGFEIRCLCRDGSLRWISWSAHPAVDESSVFAVGRDITRKRQMEADLRESERKYRNLLDVANEGIMVIDANSAIIYVNERFLKMLGYQHDEVIGKQLIDLVDAQDAPYMVERIGQRMRGVEERYDIRLIHKGGQRILTMINASPMYDDERRYVGSVSLIMDVTEKRRMENDLRGEKERLSVTLRSIGDGVIVTDNDGRVALMNDVAESLTGWKQEEAVSRPLEEVFNIINEATGMRSENPAEKVLRMGRIVGLANHTILVARDGTRRVLGDSGAPIRDDRGNILGVVLVFRDETSERRLEAEMVKMQRLESIGILAGGIAHDFNNYLTAIEGNITLARMRLEPSNASVLDRLSDAEKASVMARSLTKQLLVFSKGGEPVKRMADIGRILADSLRITLSGSNVHYRLEVEPDLWSIEVDEGQIGQTFNNIIMNARDAMPNGGIVKVSAMNVDLRLDEARSCNPGEYVSISIKDHGSGIPPDQINRLFDPYYTTKKNGKGLGLAIVHSVIKQHDGTVLVHSEEGKGTTFTIRLPVPYAHSEPDKEDEDAAETGHGRVLWMDDEAMIREVSGELLAYLGYQVEMAKNGEEAIDKYRTSKDSDVPFDIVVLDLTVPGGMGGEETMMRLMEIDPDVKAIVCSGYSNDPVMARYYDYGFRGVLSKPFSIEDLSAKLCDIMKTGRQQR